MIKTQSDLVLKLYCNLSNQSIKVQLVLEWTIKEAVIKDKALEEDIVVNRHTIDENRWKW